MPTENHPPVKRGIVYVDMPPSDTMRSLTSQLTPDIGKSLLEAFVRYTIMDPVNLKYLNRRVLRSFTRPEGITLITKTAFDALLIAREIIFYRHLREVKVQGVKLPYRVGIHCSESIELNEFNLNHNDIEIARECANQAEEYPIYCTTSCMLVAQQDRRREKRILDEFKELPPQFWTWSFEEGLFTRIPSHDHTYFISYAHKDEAIADHLEVLLRRKGRRALRDENFIKTGSSLNKQLGRQIRRSDTFISIYSDEYDNSNYCLGELRNARENKEKFGAPSRVALGRTSPNVNVPIELGDDFFYEISNRTEREKFISSLIDEEPR